MWDFYLAYCEAGFATGYLDVAQLVLERRHWRWPTRSGCRAPGAPSCTPLGGDLPVRLRAWDGSEVGPPVRRCVVLRARRALRRILWSPDELGLARAYVTGDLDVEGDLADGFRRMWAAARDR